MLKIIFTALWFFAPAGLANMVPVFAAHLPILKNWNAPLDFGKTWRGVRVFGDNKTWRGLIAGVITAIFIVWLEQALYSIFPGIRNLVLLNYPSYNFVLLGVLLGLGAIAGDAIESLVKRARGIGEGQSWFGFDQIDYIIGGIVFSYFYVPLPISWYIVVLVFYFGFHLLTTTIGYYVGLKQTKI